MNDLKKELDITKQSLNQTLSVFLDYTNTVKKGGGIDSSYE